MHSEHRDTFTDAQLGSLAQMNSKPLARPFSECPLCGGLPDDCPSLKEQERTGKPDNLPRHIAGHLKSLAMLSLPPRDEVDQTNEVTVADDIMKIQNSDSDSASLTFSDPPHPSPLDYDNPLNWDPPIHRRPNTEWDIFSSILEGMPPYSDLPDSNVLIHHSWLEPQVLRLLDSAEDDIWGISRLLILPEYPEGQLTDPKLAPFRENAMLMMEQSNEIDQPSSSGSLGIGVGMGELFGCWREAQRCDHVATELLRIRSITEHEFYDQITVLLTEVETTSRLLRDLYDLFPIYKSRVPIVLYYLTVILPCLCKTLRDMMIYIDNENLPAPAQWAVMLERLNDQGGMGLAPRFVMYHIS